MFCVPGVSLFVAPAAWATVAAGILPDSGGFRSYAGRAYPDVDVVVILLRTELSARERYFRYYPDGLPVAADLWVYTQAEWDQLAADSPQLASRLRTELLDLA
jgi:hypothetical protein